MPSNKSYDKIVTETINRINKLDSDSQIEAFLKDQGLNADERLVVLDLVEDEMGNNKIDQDEFFLDQRPKSKPKAKDLDEAANSSVHEDLSHAIGGIQKNIKENVDHKYISPIALLANSIIGLFRNIYKYFVLFLIYLIPALILNQASSLIDNSSMIMLFDAFIIFLSIIYFISLSKYIGNGNDDYLFSIKYSILNFIPIFFTIILIAMVAISMNSIAALLDVFGSNIFLKSLQLFTVAISILLIIWYSLTFFIMINEDEFYVDAISKSRKYIKSHFTAYMSRLTLFLVPYLLVACAFIWVLSIVKAFNFDLLLQDQRLSTAISGEIKIEAVAIFCLAIFILSSWLAVFLHKCYQEFAMKESFAAGKLSLRHQNMFFILLIMAPFLIGGSSIVGESNDINENIYEDSNNIEPDYSDNIEENVTEDNILIENELDTQFDSEINN